MSNSIHRREFMAAGAAAAGLMCGATQGDPIEVVSPGKELTINFVAGGQGGECAWKVNWRGLPVTLPSRLGLVMGNGTVLGPGMEVESIERKSNDTIWRPVWGERSEISDRYNEMLVHLRGRSGLLLDLVFRAYDHGAALCYRIPSQPGIERFCIAREITQFRLSADHTCYPAYRAQGEYKRARLSDVKPGCERPLTIVADGFSAAVAEARLVDYARMKLRPSRDAEFAVEADLGGKVRGRAPFSSPWRVLLVGREPKDLIEHDYLIPCLNDPCALEDTSWIRPGKVIREITLTTAGAKACVDFAAGNGLQYVEFDAGWYGPEGSWLSDARTVTLDPKRSKGPLDLPGVIGYAKERGIGVWLYVNRRQLELRAEELFALYRSWGVAGVKFGFVKVGSQKWTNWLHEAVRAAAKQKLLVDIHDEYRPAGYSRTYPNLLAQEGIRGNETFPTAAHNLVMPFTRCLAGPADYTVCWNDKRLKTTRAHQMAVPIAMFSPLVFLYWYDRPADIEPGPELSYFADLPVQWDETRVLSGAIGEYIIIARRQGEQWWVGVMNATEDYTARVNLDFLEKGRMYKAQVFSDADTSGHNPFMVNYRELKVSSADRIEKDCASNGGMVMRLEALSS